MIMKIVDGRGKVLGRLASQVAKELLKGETVSIINAEDIIITGDPDVIYEKYYQHAFVIKDKAKPVKSPKFSRRPDLFVKRVIRGMLPRRTKRGRDALSRLRVYLGAPEEVQGESLEVPEKRIRCDYITVGELCRRLGWSN